MFFFLSKTLNFLTSPLAVTCALLLLSAFIKAPKLKKKLFVSGLILLLFLSNDFIVNEVMIAWEVPAIFFKDIEKRYTYGVLLTGVTNTDPGPRDRVFFNRGADRVTHTFQLYKLGIIKKILVTGGSGRIVDSGVREADDIASVLELMGVPHEDILVESASHNTHENAVNSVKILKNKTKPEDCLLITSAYHMRRASACFARGGWKMDTFSTDFRSHVRDFAPDMSLVPRAEAMNNWDVLVKEWVGFIAYKVAGYV